MADTKISALTGATTPLAGTEVLPVVQSGATVKVATNDLTVRNVRANATTGILQVTGPTAASTRVMTVPDANFTAARIDAAQSFTGDQTLSTGNLIIGTSGKGIDFSATPGTGTSELFADYEEGTWTPADASGAGLTFGGVSATYTKIGRQVTCNLLMSYPVTADTSVAEIGGLPFAAGSYGATSIQGFFCVRNSSFTSFGLTGVGGASSFKFDKNSGTANATNADLSNTFFAATIIYQV